MLRSFVRRLRLMGSFPSSRSPVLSPDGTRRPTRRPLHLETLEDRRLLSIDSSVSALEAALPLDQSPIAELNSVRTDLGDVDDSTLWFDNASPESAQDFYLGTTADDLFHYMDDGISGQLSLPGVLVNSVFADGSEFTQLEVPGWSYANELGRPELPVFRASLVIPSDVEVVADYSINSTVVLGSSNPVFPVQAPLADGLEQDGVQSEIEFSYDTEYYAGTAGGQLELLTITDPAIVRGTTVVLVELSPFQYDPVEGQIEVVTDLTFSLSFEEVEDLEGSLELSTPSSVESAGESDISDADYLIITADDFYDEVAPLAEWKQLKGFKTHVATMSEIGSTSDDVANFISNAYDAGTPTSYVLLVGDVDDIPSNDLGTYISDHPYACVDGTDYLPDLTLGRLPVGTDAEATTVIQKILDYDRMPDMGDWYDDVLSAGFFQDYDNYNGIADRWFMETTMHVHDYLRDSQGMTMHTALCADESGGPPYYYRESSYPHRISVTGSAPYEVPADVLNLWTSASQATSDVSTAINGGVGFVQHRDHGGPTGWGDPPYYNSNVSALSNGSMTPVVFSTNCSTGTFNYAGGDSFAETFLKHPDGGAVGIVAATRTSYSGYNDLLVHGTYTSFWPDYDPTHSGNPYPNSMRPAEATNFGKYYMYSYEGDTSTTLIEFNEFHWFGDPEMMLRTETPNALTVTHPSSVVTGGSSNFTVDVSSGGSPLEGALVAITRAGSPDRWVGETDGSGQVTFAGLTTSDVGDYDLVVTEQNAVPYEGTFFSVGISGIDLLGMSFDAVPDNLLAASGTATVDFSVRNLGDTASGAFDVQFYLSDDAIIDPASDLLLNLEPSDPHYNGSEPEAYYVADLASGTTHAGTAALSVPATDPFGTDNDYYLGMFVDADGDVSEADETNNQSRGQGLDLDDVSYSIGPLDHFEWETVASPQIVGAAFSVQVTAKDGEGVTVTSFNDSVDLGGWIGEGTSSTLVITECNEDSPDYVEIQNVSGNTIDTSGWVVALNDAEYSNINSVHNVTWSLPASVAAGDVMYRTDDTSDNYWGSNIWWGSATKKGWAMIVDDAGDVVDFVAWGYTSSEIAGMSVVVNGHTVTIGDEWSGSGITFGGSSTLSLQRAGDTDENDGSDWSWVARSKGTQNTGLTVPFTGGATAVTITPVSAAFSGGVWVGDVTVLEEAVDMYLRTDDGSGHTGDSNVFSVVDTADLDYGDAPLPYPTTMALNGARHANTGPMLGSARDWETDGIPTAAADGDDLDGSDDEDGVVFTSALYVGGTANVGVTASAAAKLDAWIDFNGDGDWADAGEQIFTSQSLSAGLNSLGFLVPADAVCLAGTYARFRVSTAGGLSFEGRAADGEVEDYQVSIELASPDLAAEPASTPGTENTIYWSGVDGADAYYAEVDDNADFSSPEGNSGWITDTQYTFTGLTPGETYYYRVKARQDQSIPTPDPWTQTSQADFQANTLTSTVATSAGDVDLVNANVTLFADDFEDGDFNGWTTGSGSYTREVTSATAAAGTYSFTLSGGADSHFDGVSHSLGDLTPDRIDFSVRSSNTIHSDGYFVVGTGTGFNTETAVFFHTKSDATMGIHDGAVWHGSPYVANQWYDVSLVFDWANKEVDYYVDGGLVESDITFRAPAVDYLSNVYLYNYSSGSQAWYDEIEFVDEGGGYATSGTVISTPIAISALDSWETLAFNTTTPTDTTLTVDVLPATGSTPISGYENVSNGVDLSGITDTTIRLHANLSTTNSSVTPSLHDWTVTWQEVLTTHCESDWSNVESSLQGELDQDYGDAPDPGYPTLAASNGARHLIGNLYLGAGVDADSDGQPNATATGDDSLDGNDDEDGVVFTSPLYIGNTATVDVTSSAVGTLDAWVDFNGDGDWADAGEQIFTSEPLVAGLNSLGFFVPADAFCLSETFARFRLSTAGGLSYEGQADDGEVEDYGVSIELAAPDLAAEPASTPGTENTIYWSTVDGADAYYAEVDDNADFSSPEENSGWTTDTQYTFTSLTLGTEYYYRVKARQMIAGSTDSWTQTSEAEFSTDTLDNVSVTTSPGDVVLAGGTSTPVTDTISSTAESWTGGDRARVDAYHVTSDRILTEIEVYLSVSASTEIQFVVFESTTQAGTYTRTSSTTIASSGTGTGFYSSGPISVPLTSGRYYMIGASWLGSTTYYASHPGVVTTAFGETFGHKQIDEPYPLGTTLDPPSESDFAYYQRLTTVAGAGYEPTGAITSTVLTPTALTAWDTLTFAATTPSDTTLTIDVLPATGSTPIAGYTNVSSGVDLSGITDTSIRLRANLETADENFTPSLHDWTVTWQEVLTTYCESDWSNVESSLQGELDCDYGDAPDPSYPTLAASNGARHLIGNLYLGAGVDVDSDGQPNATATGDDSLDGNDDEDGVVFTSPLYIGDTTTVDVTSSAVGKLDAWVDFNGDGDWADAGEQIFTSEPLVAGLNSLGFFVPADAFCLSETFARFRLSTAGGLSYEGQADDGEVEDYGVSIELAAPDLAAEPASTPGTENTIYWSTVDGADAYYAEIDDNADFSSPEGNSGWITDTQYTFSDLTVGETYYYRVKARQELAGAQQGSWLETDEVDFADDVLTDTSATASPGGVVLASSGSSVEIPGIILNASFEDSSYATIADWTKIYQNTWVISRTITDPKQLVPTDGTKFLQTYTSQGEVFSAGDYAYRTQSVDFTNIDELRFDAELGYVASTWANAVEGRVLIDGAVVWSSASQGTFPDESIDVSSYTGTHTLALGLYVVTGGTYDTQHTFFDDLRTYGEGGYASSGTVVSDLISPTSLVSWGTLGFNATIPAGTSLTVDVLDSSDNLLASDVASGSNLDALGVTAASIKLRGNLSTTDTSVTPELLDWTVNWQEAAAVYCESDWSNVESSLQSGLDYGDAPDPAAGTGVGNYNTVSTDNGPSHTIVSGLYMGATVDADDGTLQNAAADADDTTGTPDDEDGLNNPSVDLALSVGMQPTVDVTVTNTTANAATLFGWIDYNGDGVFDNATERAHIPVPTGTSGTTVTLIFPTVPAGIAGTTYARFRLSTDGVAADPTGAASDGEVEDYVANILPVFTIDSVIAPEGDGSGVTSFVFTVTRNATDTAASVDVVTADGTAVAGSDYTAISTTNLYFDVGVASRTVTVEVSPDSTVEADETFTVNLSNPSGAVIATGQGTGTIANDDSATISIGDVTEVETDSGSSAFTMIGWNDGNLYDINPVTGATSNPRSTGLASPIGIATHPTTGALYSLDGSNDSLYSINRTTGAATLIGSTGQNLAEGGVEFDPFTGVLYGTAYGKLFTVDTTTGAGTVVGTIFTSGVGTSHDPNGLAFDSSGKLFVYDSLAMELVEVDKTTAAIVSATAIQNVGYSSIGGLDFDPSTGKFFLSSGSSLYSVEPTGVGTYMSSITHAGGIDYFSSGTTTFSFTVTLSDPVDTGVSLTVDTADGTAVEAAGALGGDDYEAISGGTVSFATGDLSKTVTVTVNGDDVVEANENFFVNLSAILAGGRDVTFADAQGEGTITNDDSATLTVGDVTQDEDAGVMTFTVTLDNAVQGGLNVDYATSDGTALTSDSDYTAAAGTLTFSGTAGETQTFTVPITADAKVEANETFTVTLSNAAALGTGVPGGTGTITGTDTATGTIVNDDTAPTLYDDIVGRASSSGDWFVAKSDGTSFANEHWGKWSTAVSWSNVFVGDFTGDGKDDVVGRADSTGDWFVAKATDSGFVTEHWGKWTTAVTWDNIMVGDFNGDGKDDLVGRAASSGDWFVGRSTGTGFAMEHWGKWTTAVNWNHIQVGDFNGDGYDDLVGRAPSSGDWFVAKSSSTNFATEHWGKWTTAVTWSSVLVGDFNGDGKDDVVGRADSSGDWFTSRSTGSSFAFEHWGKWTTAVNWDNIMVGDFNGDGYDDLIGRAPSSGDWFVARSSSTSFAMEHWGKWTTAVNWSPILTGDFTGDGKDDLAARADSSGDWFVSRSTGTSLVFEHWGRWTTSVPWVDIQVGDFDGAGGTSGGSDSSASPAAADFFWSEVGDTDDEDDSLLVENQIVDLLKMSE